MKKMDDKAQGSMLIWMMVLLILMFFVMPYIAPTLAIYIGYVLDPTIGFGGQYPAWTIFFAGLIVVFLSSLLTNFFTNWKKMGESQEMTKAFQKEITQARKDGNTNKMKALMKMQPEIMKRQTEASGGMMKPMLFLIIFIWPIFLWLRMFLATLTHYNMTFPWASSVSFFNVPFGFGQVWIWLYMIFSVVIGQLLRQGLKYLTWTERWTRLKAGFRPSANP